MERKKHLEKILYDLHMLLDQCLAPGPVYSHSGTVEG